MPHFQILPILRKRVLSGLQLKSSTLHILPHAFSAPRFSGSRATKKQILQPPQTVAHTSVGLYLSPFAHCQLQSSHLVFPCLSVDYITFLTSLRTSIHGSDRTLEHVAQLPHTDNHTSDSLHLSGGSHGQQKSSQHTKFCSDTTYIAHHTSLVPTTYGSPATSTQELEALQRRAYISVTSHFSTIFPTSSTLDSISDASPPFQLAIFSCETTVHLLGCQRC